MGTEATGVPRLVIIDGKDKGKVITLKSGTVVIGRSKGDILIQDARISRSHVAVHFEAVSGRLSFTDLKSLNGTLLNEKRIDEGDLKDGDRLQLGNTILDCQLADVTVSAQVLPVAPDPDLPSGVHVPEPSPGSSPEIGLSALSEELPKEPSAMYGAPTMPPSRFPWLLKIREWYARVPRRTRVYAMAAIALVGAWVLMQGPRSGSTNTTDRLLTSVQQLESEGKIDEAILKIQAHTQEHPDSPEAYFRLAGLHIRQGKLESAIAAYRRTLSISPKHREASLRLVAALAQGGKLDEANAENVKLDGFLREKLSQKEPLSAEDKAFVLDVAKLYLDQRDLQIPPPKLIILGQAVRNGIAPNSIVGPKLEAIGLILQGAPEDAVAILNRAIELDPKDESLFRYLAFAKVRLNDLNGATDTVTTWAQRFPASSEPLLVMAKWKLEAKDSAVALQFLQRILALAAKNPEEPNYPESVYLMGKVYREQGQTAEADTAFRQACELGFQEACQH